MKSAELLRHESIVVIECVPQAIASHETAHVHVYSITV